MGLDGAGRGSDHAGDDKDQHFVAHNVHPQRAGRFFVLTDGADEEAKARASQPVHQGHGGEKQRQHDVVRGHLVGGVEGEAEQLDALGEERSQLQTVRPVGQVYLGVDGDAQNLREANGEQRQVGASQAQHEHTDEKPEDPSHENAPDDATDHRQAADDCAYGHVLFAQLQASLVGGADEHQPDLSQGYLRASSSRCRGQTDESAQYPCGVGTDAHESHVAK